MTVTLAENCFELSLAYSHYSILKPSMEQLSRNFDKKKRVWRLANNVESANWLKAYVKDPSPDVQREIDAILTVTPKRPRAVDPEFNLQWTRQPMDHQKIAEQLLLDRGDFPLFMDVGTGKTQSVLDVAFERFRQNQADLLFVVCPRPVKLQWREQIAVLRPLEMDIATVVCPDQEIEEAVYFMSKGIKTVVITNYAQLIIEKKFEAYKRVLSGGKAMMCVDESHNIKNYVSGYQRKDGTTSDAKGSLQANACVELGKLAFYRVPMTGSPASENPLGLWGIFEFLKGTNQFNKLGSSFYQYRNKYCIQDPFGSVVGYRNLDKLKAILAEESYRVTKEECLSLPPITFIQESVEMGEQQEADYKEMKEKCEVVLEEFENGSVTAAIALVQMLRLSQITGGFLEDKETGEIREYRSKIDAVMEKLNEIGDKPVVIFVRFKAQMRMMCEALEAVKIKYSRYEGGMSAIDQEQARLDFQNGKVNVIVLTTAAGGIGIDLYRAEYIFRMSLAHSAMMEQQAIGRVYRKGQIAKVIVYTFLSVMAYGGRTQDHQILQCLKEKGKLEDFLLRK